MADYQEQSPLFTPDELMRHTALGMASDCSKQDGPDAVVKAAEKYLAFLKGGSKPDAVEGAPV